MACSFIQKETLAQVFSCVFCEIFKITFFTEHLRTTATKIMIDTVSYKYYIISISYNNVFGREINVDYK